MQGGLKAGRLSFWNNADTGLSKETNAHKAAATKLKHASKC